MRFKRGRAACLEAEASAAAFLAGAAAVKVELAHFRDSFFPYQGDLIKEWMSDLRTGPTLMSYSPIVGAMHIRITASSGLTSNAFRDHLILEYEIPKWDGDVGEANIYMPLKACVMDRKIELLLAHFGSQRSKDWFDAEIFRGLARLRGMECRSPERYAEAFVLRKAKLA